MHYTQTPKIPKTFTCKQNYVLVDVYELIYYNGSRLLKVSHMATLAKHLQRNLLFKFL